MMDLQTRENEIFAPTTHGGSRPDSGRKPGSKTKKPVDTESVAAPLVLNKAEERKYWRDCLARAVSDGNVKEQREILQYINEMRRGKPYVAANPRARKQDSGDKNLMIAIQNILPGSKRSASEQKPTSFYPPRRKRRLKAKADANE